MLKITIENTIVSDEDATEIVKKINEYAGKLIKENIKNNNPLKEVSFHDMVEITKKERITHMLWTMKQNLCPDNEEIRYGYYIYFDLESERFCPDTFCAAHGCIEFVPIFDEDSVAKACNYLNDNPAIWKPIIGD